MTKTRLEYKRDFDPAEPLPDTEAESPTNYGDRRETVPYVYSEEIILAVNVALAAARPLLIGGPAGSGKSSLAADVARRRRWDLLTHVVSSRTQAQDMLWTFDSLQRLRDAQAKDAVSDPKRYIRPGALWRAFDPISAKEFGSDDDSPSPGAVVLLDEIDKADPDTPNDLLIPLGSGTFTITDLGLDRSITQQRERPPLIMITTNGERDLPRAFLRRCVALDLPAPDTKRLVEIAVAHFGSDDGELYKAVAQYVDEEREQAQLRGAQPPSTAEFLDTIAACRRLGIRLQNRKEWRELVRIALAKWGQAE